MNLKLMNLGTLMLKILGKMKRKDDFKMVAIVAKIVTLTPSRMSIF